MGGVGSSVAVSGLILQRVLPPFGQDPVAQLKPVPSFGRALDRTRQPLLPQVSHPAQRPAGVPGIRVPVRAYPILNLGHERLGVGPVAEEPTPARAVNLPAHLPARSFAGVPRPEVIGHLRLPQLAGIHRQ